MKCPGKAVLARREYELDGESSAPQKNLAMQRLFSVHANVMRI
jgi:hypothetical protein